MNPLLLEILIVTTLSLFYILSKNGKGVKLVYMVLSFSIMLFIHSLVDIKCVPDLDGYEGFFEVIKRLTLRQSFQVGVIDSKIEVGYVVLNKIVSYISNFRFFLWIYSFVFLFSYFKFISSHSPFIAVSILLLLVGPFNQSLFVIRQHLAIAILLFSYPYIIDRRLYKFLLLCLVAYFIHRTTIIFVPLYFLYGLSREKLPLTLLVVAIASFFTFNIVLTFSAAQFGIYNTYIDTEGGQNYKSAVLSGLYLMAYLVILKKHIFDVGVNKFTLLLLYFYFVISFAGIGFLPTARLHVAFSSIGVLIMTPILMSNVKNQVFRFFIFICVFGIQFYLVFGGSFAQYVENFRLDFQF